MSLVELYILSGNIGPRVIPIGANICKYLRTDSSLSGLIGVIARVGQFQPILDDLFIPNEASAKDPIPTMETRQMRGNIAGSSFIRPVCHIEPAADCRTLYSLERYKEGPSKVDTK
jgi:hypothetical protein